MKPCRRSSVGFFFSPPPRPRPKEPLETPAGDGGHARATGAGVNSHPSLTPLKRWSNAAALPIPPRDLEKQGVGKGKARPFLHGRISSCTTYLGFCSRIGRGRVITNGGGVIAPGGMTQSAVLVRCSSLFPRFCCVGSETECLNEDGHPNRSALTEA